MALDPEISVVLKALEGTRAMEEMGVDELRASMLPLPLAARRAVRSIEDRVIGGSIPIRIYQPTERRCRNLMVFFHGGGFVLGSLETHDHVAREFCEATGCPVVAVDYRLAPEHRFPAATDDCLAAARWALANAASLDADPRQVVVAGDSAGGTLATVTALRLRDEGGPQLCAQVLGYPVTDYHTPPTKSYLENASGYSLTRAAMIRFWRDYVSNEADALHPLASPLRAPDLSKLPPALVVTARFDPLRDEGEAYAARMRVQGVPVTLIRYEGLIHGFLRLSKVSKNAALAFERIGRWVRSLPAPQR